MYRKHFYKNNVIKFLYKICPQKTEVVITNSVRGNSKMKLNEGTIKDAKITVPINDGSTFK